MIIVFMIVVAKLNIIKKRESRVKNKKRICLCAITKYKSNTKEAIEKKKRIIANATKIRKIKI